MIDIDCTSARYLSTRKKLLRLSRAYENHDGPFCCIPELAMQFQIHQNVCMAWCDWSTKYSNGYLRGGSKTPLPTRHLAGILNGELVIIRSGLVEFLRTHNPEHSEESLVRIATAACKSTASRRVRTGNGLPGPYTKIAIFARDRLQEASALEARSGGAYPVKVESA